MNKKNEDFVKTCDECLRYVSRTAICSHQLIHRYTILEYAMNVIA